MNRSISTVFARFAAWFLRITAGLLLVVLLLLAFLIGLLQTDWGADQVRAIAVSQINSAVDGTVEIERLDGSFISSLELSDVRVYQDGEPMASIDHASARYSLADLLNRTIHIESATITAPRFQLREYADGSWNFTRFAPTDTTADTTAIPWNVQIDALTLNNGSVDAHFFAPDRDSVLQSNNLTVRADTLYFSEETFRGHLHTFHTDVAAFDNTYRISAAGRADPSAYVIDSLKITSDATNLRAELQYPRPEAAADRQQVFGRFHADPIVFADLHPFAPNLPRDDSLVASIELDGTTEQMEVEAEAALSEGGQLSATASFTPPSQPPLTYEVDAAIRDLNLARLTGDPEGITELNGTVAADLEGPDLERLSGTANTTLEEIAWADQHVGSLELGTEWEEGQTEFRARVQAAGGYLTIDGAASPFADQPSYDLTGNFQNLQLHRLPGDYGSSRLNGRLSMNGAGLQADDLSVEGELLLRQSAYESLSIRHANLNTQVQDGIVYLTSNLDLGAGSFHTQARISPFEDPVAYRLTNGRFSEVNLEAFLDDTTMTSNLNGTLALAGEGTSLDSLTLNGELELDRSSLENRVLQDGALVTELTPSGLTIDGALDTPGGHLDFESRAEPFADRPSIEQLSATFSGIDVGYLMQDTSYTSDLTGELNLSAAGTEPSTASGAVELRLDSSRVNDQTIRSVDADLALDDGHTSITALVELADGELTLQSQLQPFEDVPTYRVDQLQFSNLHLGQWLGRPDLTTRLTGGVEAQGRGFDPQEAVFNGSIRMEESRVNEFIAETAVAEIDWTEGRLSANLAVEYDDGGITASVSGAPLDEPLVLEAQGRVDNLPAAQLAGIDTLDSRVTLEFDLESQEGSPDEGPIGGRIDVMDSHVGEITVENANVAFNVLDDGVQIDSLRVTSNVFELAGDGLIVLPDHSEESSFAYEGRIFNLAPLETLVGADSLRGSGTVSGKITGSPDTMRFALETDLAGLSYNTFHAASLDSRLTGEFTDTLRADLQATVDVLALGTTTLDQIQVDMQYAGDTLTFANEVLIDRNREGRISGRLEQIDGESHLTVDSLRMTFEDEQWRLLESTTIVYGEQLVVENLALDSGTQQMTIDGIFDSDGTHDISVAFNNVQIDQFVDLFGYDDVAGELNGSMEFAGPARSPVLDGSLTVGNFTSQGEAVGDILISANYRDFLLALELRLDHQSGRDFVVEGNLPVDLSTAGETAPPQNEVNLTVTADSTDVGWIDPFVDSEVASDIAGYLTADVDITGTFDAPELDGFTRLSQGNVGLPRLGTRYTDIDAAITFEDDRALIERAAVHSGDGHLTVDGVVNIPALDLGEFNLSVETEDFRAANTRTYQLAIDSNLRLEGTTENPVLNGTITVTEGEFYVGDQMASNDVAEVALDKQDIRQLETRFGIRPAETDTAGYDPYDALVIDTLQVNVARNVWLRSQSSPEMAIELTGDLTLAKSAGEDIQAFGTIETVAARSYVEQFGRRFQITTGILTFNGPLTEPILDIEAEYRLRRGTAQAGQAILTLQLEGPLDDLSIELGSEEGLTTSEIVSYLILGRPPQQAMQGSSSFESATATAAVSQLTDLVEGLAMSELGLDVVEIQHEADMGATLTAGAYLTQNLFASVSWPISLTDDRTDDWTTQQVTLEYVISNWLILQLERQDEINSVDLIWEYAY